MPQAANDPQSGYEPTQTNVGLIGADTPLRLEDIIPIAFPHGGVTVRSLRSEIAKGNLAVEKIAGKLFTTLADIKAMREKCRKEKDHGSIDAPRKDDVKQYGSSETDSAMSPQDALQHLVKRSLQKQRKRS